MFCCVLWVHSRHATITLLTPALARMPRFSDSGCSDQLASGVGACRLLSSAREPRRAVTWQMIDVDMSSAGHRALAPRVLDWAYEAYETQQKSTSRSCMVCVCVP